MFQRLEYQVQYRKLSSNNWVDVCTMVHPGEFFADGGTDSIPISFPTEDYYEVRVKKLRGKTVAIYNGNATGRDFAFDIGNVTRAQYEYDSQKPGNLLNSEVLDFDGTILQKRIYEYDSTYHTFPNYIKTYLNPFGTEYIAQKAKYNPLGLVTELIIEQKTQDQSVSESTVQRFEYDELYRLKKVTHEDNSYKQYNYDDIQRKIILTDEKGMQQRFSYDGLGRTVFVEVWLNGNWQTKLFNDYDSLGMLVKTLDANQNLVKYYYDEFGRLIRTVNPDGTEKKVQYRDIINVFFSLDPIPIPGLAIPDAPETLLRYEKTIDEVGNTSYRGYGLRDNVIFEAKNDGSSVKSVIWYDYDIYNRVISSRTKRGQNIWDDTRYTYDYHLPEPNTVDLPGTTEPIHTYVYNSLGQVVKEDATTENEISYHYDGAGRLINIQSIKEPNTQISYRYDRFGNIVSAEVKTNQTPESSVTSACDNRGFMISEVTQIDGLNYHLGFTRDKVGNITEITYPDGTKVSLGYDEVHQLKDITQNGNMIVQFQYNIDGTLASKRYANNLVTSYKYNPDRNWLEEIDVAGVQQLKTTYRYLPNGSVLKVNFNGSIYDFTYDGLNQIKTVETNGDVGEYLYDEASNRTSHNLRDYVYLAGNYLERITANFINIEEFSYNEYGGLRLHRKVNQDGEQNREYIYNGFRQIEEIRDNGSTIERYEYDALGRRIKIVRADETTVTLYLGNDVVYEKTFNSLGQLINETNYIVVNGVYLAKLVKEGSSPQQLYFYHTDASGSVRAVTDIVGQIVKTFEYDEFGNVIMETGSLYETPRFTGKPLDSTGLYYFNARYYDPTLGRFISADPARQGLNWYVYCNNNPLMFVDPDGESATVIGAVVGGSIGGINALVRRKNVFAGIVAGASSGAIAGAFVDATIASGGLVVVIGGAIGGGIGSGVGDFINQVGNFEYGQEVSFNWSSILNSTGWGVVFGGISGGISALFEQAIQSNVICFDSSMKFIGEISKMLMDAGVPLDAIDDISKTLIANLEQALRKSSQQMFEFDIFSSVALSTIETIVAE